MFRQSIELVTDPILWLREIWDLHLVWNIYPQTNLFSDNLRFPEISDHSFDK